MPQEPNITGMSSRRRAVFFWGLVLVFVLLLPTMIFYTTGYRLNFEDDATNIVTTGGVYISTQSTEVDVYLDEEQIERPRLFRNAYYIQNINEGMHRVVVQASDVHTWVKDLPVDSRIVTEAAAFNIPTQTRLRPITEFQTAAGLSVYQGVSATSTIFGDATSTEQFVLSASKRTSAYTINPEHEFVMSLFSSSTASTTSVFERFMEDLEGFSFVSEADPVATTTATSTPVIIERNDIQLIDRDKELYAVWLGQPNDVPYYFCVSSSTVASTSARYGQHVADAIFTPPTATSSPTFLVDDRLCRIEIKLDRLQQDVYLYDFFPGSSDLVLLHLEKGLYVTEIDDRAWQNSQPLYLGTDFRMIVENGIIYIEQNDNYFEVVTQIEVN